MLIESIVAFGACSLERPVLEPNTNVVPAAISTPPLRSARSPNGTLDVFFDGGDRPASTSDVDCVKMQEINDVADPSLRTLEVQRMGFDVTSTVEASVAFLALMGFLTYITLSLPESQKTVNDQRATESRSPTKKPRSRT